VAGPGIANFYNIYDPAQGTLNGLLSIPEFANRANSSAVAPLKLPRASAPDYFKRAELCRERLGPVLRRLSANYPPIMFHPLNTITAYKGQIIYDSGHPSQVGDADSAADLDPGERCPIVAGRQNPAICSAACPDGPPNGPTSGAPPTGTGLRRAPRSAPRRGPAAPPAAQGGGG